MSFISFIKANKTPLRFGVLLTFFSGFGQTFIIALYVPSLIERFQISNGAFGGLYGLATLCSAFTLMYLGKLIDKFSLKHYTIVAILALVISLTMMAFASNVVMLFVSLWGIRLTGQGLMTHIAITTMSRYFHASRGKAISITSLGHPIGEALFPVAITFLIFEVGWQEALLVSALALLVILLPVITRIKPFQDRGLEKDTLKTSNVKWTQRQVLKSKVFYTIAPSTFLVSMIVTTLFFYQALLAQSKGWSIEWLATCFIAYALANSLSILLSGSLVDRYTARRLFPYYLLPFAIGISLLLFFDHPWVAPIYMFLIGISVGLGSTIRSAIQAEMFGVTSLGAVRSLFSTMIVLSTAAGPALFGLLLDLGLSINTVLEVSLIMLIIVMLQSFRVLPPFRKKRIYARLKLNPTLLFQR